MKVIDADKLKRSQTYDLFYALEQAPTVEAIPLAKIKQAREDIISESFPEGEDSFSKMVYLGDVLGFIDKLIAESET